MKVSPRNAKRFLKEMKLSIVGVSNAESEKYAGHFDADFYRQKIGRDEISNEEALRHYLTTGWLDGVDPSKDFSTRGYLEIYPEIKAAGVNPLTHYVNHGIREGRGFPEKLEYRAKIERLDINGVRGWCVCKKVSTDRTEVRILIDGVCYCTALNDGPRNDLLRAGLSRGLGGVHQNLPLGLLVPGRHTVTFEMPDGTRIEDSIEVPDQGAVRRPRAPVQARDAALKIVVPIYDAVEDLEVCIERLRAHTPETIEVILIDDCSPDARIQDLLRTVSGEPRFLVLANEKNLGFTGTVNRGLSEAGQADVIILNSDARVTPGWTEGLRAAASVRPNVATVTAMSDRAGAFSAPNIGNDNPLPLGVSEEDFARAFRSRSLRLYPEVPTGNGFCMYIRRAGLDALGPLDEEAFPRGYGEENDYCMRALRAGWINLIDDATYVFHERTKSFGEAKTDNIARGREVVDRRYPEYKMLTGRYRTSERILLARWNARQALADCNAGQVIMPRALFVTATQTGGTPQTNADLMGALDDAYETWVLQCSSRQMELSRYESGRLKAVSTHFLAEAIEPKTHKSTEYDDVAGEWLEWLGAEVVHIRHLAWHSLSLPRLAKLSGAKVIYSLHDFYTLCPALKLLDENKVFCGGACTASGGSCQAVLWQPDQFPDLKNAWVHRWREMMTDAISVCDAFVTTSDSARTRILEHMPSIPAEKFHVIPHGRDFSKFWQLQNMPRPAEPMRILVPGNIDEAKGLKIILEILRLDVMGMFEFHVLGDVDPLQIEGNVPRLILHGTYKRDTMAQKIEAIAPHFGAVLSIWDETFCHTLTEMWAVGLPVVVLDFPTLRARVENSEAGWVVEDTTPEGVYATLAKIAANPSELREKGDAAIRWQAGTGAAQTCRMMASRYLDVYRGAREDEKFPTVAVVVSGASTLRHANASAEIRVWERTRNASHRAVNYVRMAPSELLGGIETGALSGVIIQRTAIPMRMIGTILAAAKAHNVPYVYELDDDLFSVPAEKDQDGFYAAYRPFLADLVENAAAVTVSTELLAREIRPRHGNVTVLPNKVSARLWKGDLPRQIGETPRLLYMGTNTHDEDLAFLLTAMTRARQTLPALRLSLVGVTGVTDQPDWVDVIAIPDANKSYSRFVPWLKRQVAEVDLAVAPLMETEFNRCKSGLKILDYAALGLPVLASSVPSYQSLDGPKLPKGVTLLANSPNTWAQAIVSRIKNRWHLSEQGDELRDWVFAHHTLEAGLSDYDALVLAAIEGDEEAD